MFCLDRASHYLRSVLPPKRSWPCRDGLCRAPLVLLVGGLMLVGVSRAMAMGGIDDTLPETDMHGAPEPMLTVSAASELVYGYTDFGWPSKEKPLRIGIVRYIKPAPLEGLVDATVTQLENFFGKDVLDVQSMTLEELSEAVQSGTVDIFIASSGRYRRLVLDGARDLATGLSKAYPDPNRSEASAMVVLDRRRDLSDLTSLRGQRLVSSVKEGFSGHDIPMGELVRAGLNPQGFFREEFYLGDGGKLQHAFSWLLEGRADVAFMRLCFLEENLEKHPEWRGQFRVINNLTKEGEICQRSTQLYPAWTAATTHHTDPRLSRLVTRALLQMPPAGTNGFYWGVATDYSSTDQLFEQLRVGPYQYLNAWTLPWIWERTKWWILGLGLVFLLLIAHSLRVGYLVRLRTEALTRAMATQEKLQREARAAGERIDRLEKMGAVGQLSSIFAHEMRQPLSAISLYVFALKKGLMRIAKKNRTNDEVLDAKLQSLLGKVENETERANAIVERVRSYAKADRPPRELCSIRALLGRAADDLRLSARFTGVITIVPGADATLALDALGFELVFVNLIKNALEATDSPHDKTVRVSLTQDDQHVWVKVENRAPALSETAKRALAGEALTTKKTGLGLGLAIVRGILEAHGARLDYRVSPWGEGNAGETHDATLEETVKEVVDEAAEETVNETHDVLVCATVTIPLTLQDDLREVIRSDTSSETTTDKTETDNEQVER